MSISGRPVMPLKTAYHHGDLRNALLGAARALVAEGRIDSFGLREVARRAGVSHAAVYNHFASRAALVEVLVVEAYGALAAELLVAELAASEPLARLQDVGIAYVRFAYEHQAQFRFMFRPEHCAIGDDPRAVALRAVSRAAYEPLVRAIAACREAGLFAGDPETLALTAWSGVHGLAALIVDGPLREEALDLAGVEALARAVTATLCDAAVAGRR